jgi:glycine cleavage system H lipoate-binding protein
MIPPGLARRATLFGFAFSCGCAGEEESLWVRFNTDDTIDVQITAEPTLGPIVEVELHSTTGSVVVGAATVDPGSGPVGTDHVLLVTVSDEWQDQVGRVTVLSDSGARGTAEHEFVRDSADHGVWERTLTSLGEEGETRTDAFTFQLWEATPGETGVASE